MISIDSNLVTRVEVLQKLYEAPGWAAHAGECDRLIAPYRAFVEASPYVTLATIGLKGIDCSPRGDAPGFMRIHDENTILIPDRAGNNRIDSLRNILHDPRIALHVLVPGCGETLRVVGRATISADRMLAASFAVDGKAPRTVIIVAIERVYFHCGKAIRRSKLWDHSRHVEPKSLPSVNTMLAAVQWQRCRDVFRARRKEIATDVATN